MHRSRTIAAVLTGFAVALASCTEPDDPLDGPFPDPADYPCTTPPTTVHPPDYEVVPHTCAAADEAVINGVFRSVASAPNTDATYAAWLRGDGALPDECQIAGQWRTGNFEGGDCAYAYRAQIGVVDDEVMVIDYEIRLDQRVSCWSEDCDLQVRVRYREGIPWIAPH